MSIYSKLVQVQNELKAPKGQYNSFGKYNYRNQEDILEAVKPLLLKHNLTLMIKDTIELIGERYYIKATCVLIDTESGETLENTALARESEDKKGMDASQVTGSTSSYARKYALNGLFLIDDTKDADTDEFQTRTKPTGEKETSSGSKERPATDGQKKFVTNLIDKAVESSGRERNEYVKELFGELQLKPSKELTYNQAQAIINHLK